MNLEKVKVMKLPKTKNLYKVFLSRNKKYWVWLMIIFKKYFTKGLNKKETFFAKTILALKPDEKLYKFIWKEKLKTGLTWVAQSKLINKRKRVNIDIFFWLFTKKEM